METGRGYFKNQYLIDYVLNCVNVGRVWDSGTYVFGLPTNVVIVGVTDLMVFLLL